MLHHRWFVVLSLTVVGCQQGTPPVVTTAPPAAQSAKATDKLLLTEAPANPQEVKLARQEAKDNETITIVGRIGGELTPFVKDKAAFTIVDRSLVPCNEREGDKCKTPWDYCCDLKDLPTSKALVKLVDADGKLISQDARDLLQVTELRTVIAQGKAQRDDAGNLTVLAQAIYVVPAKPAP